MWVYFWGGGDGVLTLASGMREKWMRCVDESTIAMFMSMPMFWAFRRAAWAMISAPVRVSVGWERRRGGDIVFEGDGFLVDCRLR